LTWCDRQPSGTSTTASYCTFLLMWGRGRPSAPRLRISFRARLLQQISTGLARAAQRASALLCSTQRQRLRLCLTLFPPRTRTLCASARSTALPEGLRSRLAPFFTGGIEVRYRPVRITWRRVPPPALDHSIAWSQTSRELGAAAPDRRR